MKQTFFDDEKLWQITLAGTTFTTAYGKTYNSDSLRETTKSFDSEEKASKEAEKLIAKKVKSGYQKLRFNLDAPLEHLCSLQTAQDQNATTLSINEDCSEAFIE